GAPGAPVVHRIPTAVGAVGAVDVEESAPVGGRQVLAPAGPQQSQARGDADAGGDQGRGPAEDAGGGHGSVRAGGEDALPGLELGHGPDRKSTRLNSSHVSISYAVFCLKKKKKREELNGGEHLERDVEHMLDEGVHVVTHVKQDADAEHE